MSKKDPHWLRAYLTPNFYSKKDGPPKIIIPTDEESAAPIIQKMEHDLSPENLHMDGEATNVQVRAKQNLIFRAKADLELILGRKIDLEY